LFQVTGYPQNNFIGALFIAVTMYQIFKEQTTVYIRCIIKCRLTGKAFSIKLLAWKSSKRIVNFYSSKTGSCGKPHGDLSPQHATVLTDLLYRSSRMKFLTIQYHNELAVFQQSQQLLLSNKDSFTHKPLFGFHNSP